MSEMPQVCLIKDLAPDNPATLGTLRYRNLAAAALRFKRADTAFLENVWHAPHGSMEEMDAAQLAAGAYLTRIANQVTAASTPKQHDLWAERFTQASIEIFGQPDPHEAKLLTHRKQLRLFGYQSDPNVDQRSVDYLLQFYSSAVGEPEHRELSEVDRPLWPEINDLMQDRFGPLLDIIDNACSGKKLLSPVDRKKIAVDMLKWLAENHHSAWARWQVTEKNDATFSVYQESEEVVIGMLAAPATPARVKNTSIHEILIHGLRCINGKRFNKQLGVGLSGRDTFEEGLATLFGWALSKDANEGPSVLYRNIALALGTIGENPVPRSKLLCVTYHDAKVFWQSRGGKGPLPLKVKRDSFVHAAGRIFKGGRGDNFGENQAVFTKDIVYHEGYKRAERYIQHMLETGKTMGEIFDYLMLGGFDPENCLHAEYVRQVTGQKL